VLTIITYLIGQSLSDIKALIEATTVTGQTIPPITVKVVQIAYYVFPNLSFFDIKTNAAYGIPLPLPVFAWTVAYGLIYTTLAISAAAFIFRKKEFP